MRAAVAFAVAAVALSACAAGSAGTSTSTSLTVTYWPNGANQADRTTWTLRCNPARGTLARPKVACARLLAGGMKLFAPIRGDVACTQIYGGPDVARVVGTVKGNRVHAQFNRTDGCQISRWDGLSPWLLPRGGVR